MFALLQRDYDQVARMTVPDTWAPYGGQFAGEKAMQSAKEGDPRFTAPAGFPQFFINKRGCGTRTICYAATCSNNPRPTAPLAAEK